LHEYSIPAHIHAHLFYAIYKAVNVARLPPIMLTNQSSSSRQTVNRPESSISSRISPNCTSQITASIRDKKVVSFSLKIGRVSPGSLGLSIRLVRGQLYSPAPVHLISHTAATCALPAIPKYGRILLNIQRHLREATIVLGVFD